MADLEVEKKALRKVLLRVRRTLTDEQRKTFSNRIWETVESSAAYDDATCIMVYAAMPDEVDSIDFLRRSIAAGKKVYIPRILGRAMMEAARLQSVEELVPGAYGILEPPKANAIIDPVHLDLILVPGVGFSVKGDRLGMGGGYYDRFLPRAASARRVAVIFSCQLVDAIPHDANDQGVDAVITELGAIQCR